MGVCAAPGPRLPAPAGEAAPAPGAAGSELPAGPHRPAACPSPCPRSLGHKLPGSPRGQEGDPVESPHLVPLHLQMWSQLGRGRGTAQWKRAEEGAQDARRAARPAVLRGGGSVRLGEWRWWYPPPPRPHGVSPPPLTLQKEKKKERPRQTGRPRGPGLQEPAGASRPARGARSAALFEQLRSPKRARSPGNFTYRLFTFFKYFSQTLCRTFSHLTNVRLNSSEDMKCNE